MVNWREVPFVRLLVPLIIGISVGLFIDAPLPLAFYFLLFLFIGIAVYAHRHPTPRAKDLFSFLVNLSLILTGYMLSIHQNDYHHGQHFRHFLQKENTFIGRVYKIQTAGAYYLLSLEVEQIINADSSIENTCGGILVSIIQSDIAPDYGDRLMMRTGIRPTEAPKNPEAFDYQRYLKTKGIYHQAFLSSGQWVLLEKDTGNPLLALTYRWRKNLLEILKQHLPTENEYAVASAMLLGSRDHMNEEIKNAYAATGATHVMAVSGLHIGLVFFGIGLLLRLLYWRNTFLRYFKPLAMLAGIWLFALMSGAAPSAMRAAFMFSLIIISQSLHRQGSIYNTLAASAFCLLCFQPGILLEAGFQLSYLAVGGIVFFQPKIYKLWYIENKIGQYFWKMVSVGLAAQIMTFPLCIYYFHQFPLYFWLSGLVVVPAATLIIGLGSLLFLTHYTLSFMSPFIGKILWGCITAMNGLIFLIQQLPAGLIEGIWTGIGILILLYLMISLVIFTVNSQKSRWLVYAVSSFVLLMATTAFTDIERQTQNYIAFYYVPGHQLIDFIHGKFAVSFADEQLPLKKKERACTNFRISRGIRKVEEELLNTEGHFENSFLKYRHPLLQFLQYKMAMVNYLDALPPPQPVEVDAVFIFDNPDISIETLQKHFAFRQIIIATSNTKKKTAAWLFDCQREEIPCYVIREQGAYVMSL